MDSQISRTDRILGAIFFAILFTFLAGIFFKEYRDVTNSLSSNELITVYDYENDGDNGYIISMEGDRYYVDGGAEYHNADVVSMDVVRPSAEKHQRFLLALSLTFAALGVISVITSLTGKTLVLQLALA